MEEPKEQLLVPFGKYKGEPLEILATDKKYMEWLCSQEFFRTKFNKIYTIVINNFTTPSNTPEHNGMQVLFLDDDFCLKFFGRNDSRTLFLEKLGKSKQNWMEATNKFSKEYSHWRLPKEYGEEFTKELTKKFKEIIELKLEQDYVAALSDKNYKNVFVSKLFEERGWDAILTFRIPTYRMFEERDIKDTLERKFDSIGNWIIDKYFQSRDYSRDHRDEESIAAIQGVSSFRLELVSNLFGVNELLAYGLWHNYNTIFFECKPSIGDDYPEVLRQMKGKPENPQVLLLGDGGYTGVGATFEQVIKIFEHSKIKIIKLSDVRAFEFKQIES
jgi:hypothetical protein